MNNSKLQKSLSEAEIDKLSDFLESIGPSAMNIETLDGYFCALIAGPEMVMPSEYLHQIWGEDYSFESEMQASEIVSLIFRHWNAIASTLRGALEKPDVYLPILLEDEDGTFRGNNWAAGFLKGVTTRPHSWNELLNSEDEQSGVMIPIMLLAHEHDIAPEMRSPAIPEGKREEIIEMMIASLTVIYRYFEPTRQSYADGGIDRPIQRGPKIGRNDMCPCGSGEKYKNCCATNTPMVH